MAHHPPPARLLDLTRLMRRVGKVLTGVDRVELAYARALVKEDIPLFGLMRSRLGYVLLDQVAIDDMLPALSGRDLNIVPEQQKKNCWRRARKRAIGRVPPALLGRMLRRALPSGVAYINVGHSNLTKRVLRALHSVDARVTVMVHDVIPLDFPQFQRDDSIGPFADMMARAGAEADLLIYNSEATRQSAEAHLPHPPRSIVAHLGTDDWCAAPEDLPAHMPPIAPYFVCVGTIEPRKNHALLLDIWRDFGDDAPHLVIIGTRGWRNEDVFARLDALPAGGPVHEISGLSDGAVTALVAQSAGMVFPSYAEGFGLPATEAAVLGVPVIVNDLPVYRETLGDIPIYASVSDRYLWSNTIKRLAMSWPDREKRKQFKFPTWEEHFKIVLRLT